MMFAGQFVVDGHADILYRMGAEGADFYQEASKLHQGYHNLRASGVDLQVFVTFVDPVISASEQLYRVLASLYRFQTQVCRNGCVVPIFTKADLESAILAAPGPMAALLSLEGADALGGEISVLHALFSLGVRLMGLTWNGANCVGDGVGEARGAGLTSFGFQVVRQMNALGMVIDVSHLGARGVWDVLETSQQPIIASHSNAFSVYPHRRNLTDEQIRAIAKAGGVIGATFVPDFVGPPELRTTDELLRHIDHLLDVAGPDAVGLGSDFDGIETTLIDLRNGQDYPAFMGKMMGRYGPEIFAKLVGGNLLRVLMQVLPTA